VNTLKVQLIVLNFLHFWEFFSNKIHPKINIFHTLYLKSMKYFFKILFPKGFLKIARTPLDSNAIFNFDFIYFFIEKMV